MHMNIIFDLDGTLVNSAPGVLDALSYVIEKHEIESPVALSVDLIGPPLREMLIQLSSSTKASDLDLMELTIKSYYDQIGIFKTAQYEGVSEMLGNLIDSGHMLFIATNKRASPTHSLMKYFSWDQYFVGAYSLDSFDYPIEDKAALLEKVILTHQLLKDETIYIGDRPEDNEAAKKCAITFMYALWGYGGKEDCSSRINLKLPNEIRTHLNKII
jgi:phosphoglycolate phosphatase